MRRIKKSKEIAKAVVSGITNEIVKLPKSEVVKIGAYMSTFPYWWNDSIPFKPLGFDEFPLEVRGAIITFVYQRTERLVGEKAIARYRETKLNGKTEQEFEDFWEHEKEGKKSIIPLISYLLLIASVLLFSISAVVELFR